MKPVHFKEANFLFRKPEGMSQSECGDMPCLVEEKAGLVTSCWKMTDEELAEVIRTRQVWLSVKQFPVAPTSLDGIKPIKTLTIQLAPEAVSDLQKKGILPKQKKER